ncbi:hypothetical protein JST97_03285 [bacterium]|nr:hypothetical protein [bacterium]
MNWNLQVLAASSRDEQDSIPEPRADENGTHPGPPCDRYRATLFAPGFCWCSRPRAEHSGEIVRLAEQLLKL